MAIFRKAVFGITIFSLVACNSAAQTSLPTIAVAPIPTTQPASPTETELSPTLTPSLTPTTEPTHEIQPTLSPNSRTGITIVDAVIEAVLASEADKVMSLIHYTTTGCTQAEGLGGPPKCDKTESEGTMVEVFPESVSEGFFVRKGQVTFDLEGYGLYGAYQVSPNAAAQSEGDYWPMGDYGIIFVTQSASSPELYLNTLVDETGIVRVGYSFSLEDAIWEGTIEDFILPPVIMPDLNQ